MNTIHEELSAEDISLMRRALGATDDVRRSSWGYRNKHVATVSEKPTTTYIRLKRLVRLGMMDEAGLINSGCSMFFIVTEKGCKAIGLTDTQIKRAFEP